MLSRLPPRCSASQAAQACRKSKKVSDSSLKSYWSIPQVGSSQRPFSAASGGSASNSPLKVSHILSALLVFGVGATAWGLYEFYSTLTIWPPEVRSDLRSALRAKERGDLKLSMRHFARASDTVQKLPAAKLGAYPYLKVSGVAIAYGAVLEMDGHLNEAFRVLHESLALYIQNEQQTVKGSSVAPPKTVLTGQDPSSSSSQTHHDGPPKALTVTSSEVSQPRPQLPDSRNALRAIAIALKLGDLAEALEKPDDEGRCLNFAATEVLRVIRKEYGLRFQAQGGFIEDGSAKKEKEGEAAAGPSNSAPKEGHANATTLWDALAMDNELDLPAWSSVTRTELAAPFERLAAFNARQGNPEQAITLYRIASSFLTLPKPLPPAVSSSSPSSTSPSASSSSSPLKGKTLPPLSSPSTTIQELCQALQIENAHMALLMALRRQRPSDEHLARDLPRVLNRAGRLANEATMRSGRVDSDVLGSGERGSRNGGKGAGWSGARGLVSKEAEMEMALCDQAYPAVLYNAGVYYEEENKLDIAMRSYSLAYRALSVRGGPKDQTQAALENARRLQRILERKSRDDKSKPVDD